MTRKALIAGLLPAAGLALIPAVALAQTLGTGGGTELPWWRVVGALSLCLLLAAGAAIALKLRSGGQIQLFTALSGADRRLQLVETLRLNHQVDICVLRLDQREFVVAASPQGALLLVSGDAPPLTPATAAAAATAAAQPE